MGEAVVSRSDPAKVFQAAEHALDGIAVTIKVGREAILPASVDLGRDVRRGPLAFDLSADAIAVIPLVAVQNFGRREVVEQGIGGNAVRDLAAGQQECDRAAEAIGQRVDLCRAPAARATDRLCEFPPFPPAAQR